MEVSLKLEGHGGISNANVNAPQENPLDVAIIGAGPAGLSAGIYASRYSLKCAVIGQEVGGLITEAHIIENYPGFTSISGSELMDKFVEHTKSLSVPILNKLVVAIQKESNLFKITLDNNTIIYSKTVVFALGTKKRKLNVENEDKFLGKGVSYCYTCDAAFFKDKVVSVIGGADSAALAALLLSDIASQVYLIYRKRKMRCQPILLNKIKSKKNIEIIYDALPEKFEGDDTLKKIILKPFDESKPLETKEVNVDGCFVEIGEVPLSTLAKDVGVKLNDHGYIITDIKKRTNVDGIFAAGDCATTPLRQVITASADGAIAATSAFEYMNKK